LFCLGQRSTHVVNGQTVMRLSGIRQPAAAGEVPLTAGHVQLQSEGGEVFFRDIEIRGITSLTRV
jgi:hypothetical protein